MNQNRMQIFQPTTSKSGIFLLELIIVILFFSIASTVCIEMFVNSYTINNESTHLSKCVQISENIAESFKNTNIPAELANPITYYYDTNGVLSSEDNYTYYAHIFFSSSESIASATIDLYTMDSLIYSLQIDKHIPERWDENEK